MALLLPPNSFQGNFKIHSLLHCTCFPPSIFLSTKISLFFYISVEANVHWHRMTNIFIVKWKTLHSSSSPVKVAFRSSSPCAQWKLACKLKYDKILPKHSLTDTTAVTRDLYETGNRTWAATGLKATAVTVLVCPASLREKVLELVSYTYAWKTECTDARNCAERKQVPQLTKHQSHIRGSWRHTAWATEATSWNMFSLFPLRQFAIFTNLHQLSIFCHEPPQNPVNRFKYMLMCED